MKFAVLPVVNKAIEPTDRSSVLQLDETELALKKGRKALVSISADRLVSVDTVTMPVRKPNSVWGLVFGSLLGGAITIAIAFIATRGQRLDVVSSAVKPAATIGIVMGGSAARTWGLGGSTKSMRCLSIIYRDTDEESRGLILFPLRSAAKVMAIIRERYKLR